MGKPLPSLSTRTDEFRPLELPLEAPSEPPRPIAPLPERPASERIRDALRRWLEEEL